MSGVATQSLLKSLAELPVDLASSVEIVSTLDLISRASFLSDYPECDIDLVMYLHSFVTTYYFLSRRSDGGGRQLDLTLEFFGGAPGYLAKLVDLVLAHQKRYENNGNRPDQESDGVRLERERMEELRVYQLAKALAGAPAWKDSSARDFPLDVPLKAQFYGHAPSDLDTESDVSSARSTPHQSSSTPYPYPPAYHEDLPETPPPPYPATSPSPAPSSSSMSFGNS